MSLGTTSKASANFNTASPSQKEGAIGRDLQRFNFGIMDSSVGSTPKNPIQYDNMDLCFNNIIQRDLPTSVSIPSGV
jgi:hypothetical protein